LQLRKDDVVDLPKGLATEFIEGKAAELFCIETKMVDECEIKNKELKVEIENKAKAPKPRARKKVNDE